MSTYVKQSSGTLYVLTSKTVAQGADRGGILGGPNIYSFPCLASNLANRSASSFWKSIWTA